MKKLICENPLLNSKILILSEKIESLQGKLKFIHKYHFALGINKQFYSVKINAFDDEFYVLDHKGNPLHIFPCFEELEVWVDEQLQKDKPS